MILDSFLNVFTEADGATAADGFWRISHPNAVFDKLRHICGAEGYSYEWQPGPVTFHPVDARTIINGTLKVFEVANPAVHVTVPGTAIGQTIDNDVAGVTTSAFTNACLRGLGMAQFAYALPRGPVSTPPPAPAPVQMQPAPTMAPPNPPNRPPYNRPPANGGGYGGQHGAPRRQFEWDGELTIKSGQHAGTKYKDMPIEVLQKWTAGSDPNKSAVKELERRMKMGGALPQVDAGFQGGGRSGGYSDVPNLDEVPY